MQALNPDLLTAIASHLPYPSFLRLMGTCRRIQQSIAPLSETKHDMFLLPQSVARRLAEQIALLYDTLYIPWGSDGMSLRLYPQIEKDQRICLMKKQERYSTGDPWIEISYSLRTGHVTCEFPARRGRMQVDDQRLWAAPSSQDHGQIVRLHDAANYDPLNEYEHEEEYGCPMHPIAYSDGILAFMRTRGLLVG